MAQLNAGIPAQEIAKTLAKIRIDKLSPHYYAHRTVDIAMAVQLVRKGVDYGSLIEGLKTRNSALSADRATEIARTAFRFVQRIQFCTSRRTNMPLLEITQSRQISASVRLDEATATQVDQYAPFIKASADDVVDNALNYVFAKDRDFQDFLKTPEVKQISSTLRVRKVPSSEGIEQPAKKATSAAVPVESVRAVKA
jgi:hypothetical protein